MPCAKGFTLALHREPKASRLAPHYFSGIRKGKGCHPYKQNTECCLALAFHINSAGMVVAKWVGPLSWPALQAKLALLGEKA